MGRSFYNDEETTYSVPGLPTVAQVSEPKTQETIPSNSSINEFGNYITTSIGLENFVSKVRQSVRDYYEIAEEKYLFYTGTAQAHFGMTAARIYEFKAEDEQLLPNGCGVLTAALFGSIVARNHALPIRFFTPVLFGAVALKYALPQTYRNVSQGFENLGLGLESKYFPEFTETRKNACAKVSELSKSFETIEADSWNSLVGTVSCARKSIIEAIGKKD